MASQPRTCNTCRFWSPYAPGLGECLQYARARAQALRNWDHSKRFSDTWPSKAAPDTEDTDTCDKHEPLHA